MFIFSFRLLLAELDPCPRNPWLCPRTRNTNSSNRNNKEMADNSNSAQINNNLEIKEKTSFLYVVTVDLRFNKNEKRS